jgi:hypothetical protein
MKKVTDFIDRLVEEYKYKPLPEDKSIKARAWYEKHLPKLNPEAQLLDGKGKLIAINFNRIVIGDYGAFIEFEPNSALEDRFWVPKLQEFRLRPNFYGKYIWMTSDGENKIYKQIRGVSYADYKPGMYYISPYEVTQ